jgi:uncharacterized membrane protein (DUF4010 family)
VRFLLAHVSLDAVKVTLTLALSFLVGLEREEHKAKGEKFAFGGVRTFPLIGVLGYALALLAGPGLLLVGIGFAVVGGFMLLSYRKKLAGTEEAGITSELSALVTYVVGAMVSQNHLWLATSLTVASVLLLELKAALESLTRKLAADEIISLAKFLLLSAVILPVVPNENLTRFELNPFKIWLIVVAVSSVSYGSYLLSRWLHGRGGVFLSALLGGAYSSTVTTVVLARSAKADPHPRLYAGCILAASGMMYLRLTLLLLLFGRSLVPHLGVPFLALGVLAIAFGWFWSRRDEGAATTVMPRRNPLDLGAAFIFALIFVAVLIMTRLVLAHVGSGGVYSLAALMGVADVDPFILGLTQSGGTTAPHTLAVAIAIAAASNNLGKGFYALAFADRRTGVASLALLAGLAALGLVPWLWL